MIIKHASKNIFLALKSKYIFVTLFILIIAFAFLIRIVYLDRIPVGITNDELDFALNAKAVFLTGKDIAQVWNPFSLTTITGEFPRAELPYALLAPFIGPLNFSLFNDRFPYAVAGTIVILLTALISWKLFDRKAALLIAIMGAINPWSIFFSRTGFEVTLAILFFLFGFYLLLLTQGWKIMYSAIPFFLGFYCYMGTKLIFIPMTLIFILYSWRVAQKGKSTAAYISLFLVCLAIFATFLFNYSHSAAQARGSNELYTPFSSEVSAKVENYRRLSIHAPLTSLYSNKLTVFAVGAIEKYMKAFSPTLLFTNGDSEGHQTLFYHGNFYYIDVIFMLIGLSYLFLRNKKVFLLIVSLIIISPLPSVASNMNVSYSLRSSLLFPFLIMLVGLGLYAVVTSTVFQKRKLLFSVLLLGVYVLLFSNFLNIYLFRYPIYNSEATNFSVRLLSRYMFHQSEHKNVFVVTGSPEDLFSQYLFYNNLYNNSNKDQIAQIYRELHTNAPIRTVSFGNVTIANCPISPTTISGVTVIMDANTICKKLKIMDNKAKPIQTYIAALDDGRRLYTIYNAAYCVNNVLEPYPHDIKLSDLQVEKLSDERFCTKFISKPRQLVGL